MICGGGVCFHPDELVKILHKLRDELYTTIADDFSGESVFAPDVVSIVFSGFNGGKFGGSCD